MNALVVYDSQFGNTERIAQAIARALGEFGEARATRVDPTHPAEPQGVDLLILGCPTQGWRPTLAMQSYLTQLVSAEAIKGLAVACFDTRFHKPGWLTGSAAKRIAGNLRTVGVVPLLPPESFFVLGTQGPLEGGEVERAAKWAVLLHQRFEAAHPQPIMR
jgi:flavodoxin